MVLFEGMKLDIESFWGLATCGRAGILAEKPCKVIGEGK